VRQKTAEKPGWERGLSGLSYYRFATTACDVTISMLCASEPVGHRHSLWPSTTPPLRLWRSLRNRPCTTPQCERVKICFGQTDHLTRRISCQKLFHLTIKWTSAGLREREAGWCPFASGNERTLPPSAETHSLAVANLTGICVDHLHTDRLFGVVEDYA
jgi:hypothetical protein